MFARTARSHTKAHTLFAAAALTLSFAASTLADPHTRVINDARGTGATISVRSRGGDGWRISVPRREEHRRHTLDASCLESCVRIDGHEVKVHLAITRDRRGELNAKLTLSTDDHCDLDIDAVTLKITSAGETWKQNLEECTSRHHDTTTFESHDAARIRSCTDLRVSLRIYTESDDVDTASWRDVELH